MLNVSARGKIPLPPVLEGNMKIPYFSHDQNARNDPKITKIRAKYGLEGYGCYFVLLEMMSAERERRLDYSDDFFDAIARGKPLFT